MKLDFSFLKGSAPEGTAELVHQTLGSRSDWGERLSSLARISSVEGDPWRICSFTYDAVPEIIRLDDRPDCFGDPLLEKTPFPEDVYEQLMSDLAAHCAVYQDIQDNHKLIWRFWGRGGPEDAERDARLVEAVMDRFASASSAPVEFGDERILMKWGEAYPNGNIALEGVTRPVVVNFHTQSYDTYPGTVSQKYCDLRHGFPEEVKAIIEASRAVGEDPEQSGALQASLEQVAASLKSTFVRAEHSYDALRSVYRDAEEAYLADRRRLDEEYGDRLREGARGRVSAQL